MIQLRKAEQTETDIAMKIINQAKAHLKEQGIDQWQSGYPDRMCIEKDIRMGKGYFLAEKSAENLAANCIESSTEYFAGNEEILGYLCIDFDGEPAYESLDGTWLINGKYVVVHRLALADEVRGKGISFEVFRLVEELCRANDIHDFRVDTDAGNMKMQHILKKTGFEYRGTIEFDDSEKIAFEKIV